MVNKLKPLKYIFSNYFFKFWRIHNNKFPAILHHSIFSNVIKFLRCGDITFGFSKFLCSHCGNTLFVPFSCKSRFCSSCGKIYAENWANQLSTQLFNVPHLHMTLSLPKGPVRDFFFKNRFLLKDLAEAANQSIKYSFNKFGVKHFGNICVIHTFARDVSWNPHIHCILTMGGFDSNNNWISFKSLPWKVLRASWQKCTLDILSDFAKKNNSVPIKNTVSLTYRKYPNGFYVNSDNLINNPKQIAKYIGHYLARPPIAEYRITFFNSSIVKFWFKNPDSNNKIFLTLDINTFIGRLLAHIPPSNFKMVRRFGIYSRNSNIKKPMNFRIFIPKITWAQKIFKTYGVNPLVCNKCNSTLTLVEIFHCAYGFIFPKNSSP